MRAPPTCPRCGEELRSPGLWSSTWQCASHGSVAPYTVLTHPGVDMLNHVVGIAQVPVWLPVGLPRGWLCSGFAYAGDERTGASATVTCMSGPGPLGGPADLLLVAEEPAVGLGSRHAGLGDADPGAGFDAGAPETRLAVAGHPTPFWSIPVPDGDRAVFVGEAKARWLWLVVHPASAGLLLYDEIELVDACDAEVIPELSYGSVSPLLSARPA